MPKMSKSAMRKQMLDMAEGSETETPEVKATESETETPEGTVETETETMEAPEGKEDSSIVNEINSLVDNFKSELDAGGDPKELALKLSEDLKASIGSKDTSNEEAPLNMPPSDMMG